MAKFSVEVIVDDDKIDNLLCSAFEGGSNYWASSAKAGRKPKEEAEWLHEWPLKGGSFIIYDAEEDKHYEIGREELHKGLKAMSEWGEEEGRHHFANIIKDEIDSDTGDAFLQACCFGKLIYG